MSRVPPDLEAINEVYIDESSQTAHQYLVIGGAIIHAPHREALEAALQRARLPELPAMEMGWTKVSKAKLIAYRRFVDVFFDNLERLAPLHFHCIIVNTHHQNHRVYNEGSGEIGFNKEVFQLCNKFAWIYGDKLLHIYPDARSNKTSPNELRFILNRFRANRGDRRDWPFRRVHPQDSSRWQTLQLVDLLIGAVAFRANRHHLRPEASASKCELSTHILRRARITDVLVDTGRTGKFTIWNRKLKGVSGP